jgi:DNA-directed RNA polymerase specialized sigma24 family protein
MPEMESANAAEAQRRAYLDALDDFELAAQALEHSLRDAIDAVPELRAHMSSGAAARDVPTLLPDKFKPRPLRAELSDAIGALERARHDTQRAFFSLLVGEGMTMADIGRMVGISRSLVSRILNEGPRDA